MIGRVVAWSALGSFVVVLAVVLAHAIGVWLGPIFQALR